MTYSEHELEFTFAKNRDTSVAEIVIQFARWRLMQVPSHHLNVGRLLMMVLETRNSSGDEIANVKFLYDDIVHAVVLAVFFILRPL